VRIPAAHTLSLSLSLSLSLPPPPRSSSHSLRYFTTIVSDPGEKVPPFFSVGYVDDQEFVSYDAQARRDLPKVPWMRKVDKEDPQYWERNSQVAWNREQIFRVDLGTLSGYYNQSGGDSLYQMAKISKTSRGPLGNVLAFGQFSHSRR
uniref:MHC class I-like antigen recognition-like domain-containing protein n=1 Tax=Anolis carolinensis TaxID=28377 RepID=A0A803TBN5_ANOCA